MTLNSPTVGFSGRDTAELAGITYRQLDYWARTGLVRPSLVDARGSGIRRRYSLRDLLSLMAVKHLLDSGLCLAFVREVIEELEHRFGADLVDVSFVVEGSSVIVRWDDEIFDLLHNGQRVLDVLPQTKANEELYERLARLSRRLSKLGPPQSTRTLDWLLPDTEYRWSKLISASYHEAGHAIIGLTVPQHDPVHKVTIVPRGRALGVTMFLPEEDRYSHSKQSLISKICTLYGGRLAEEIIFGKEAVTTGASNDIERVTEIARNMVTKWGLSDRLGPIAYDTEDSQPFLGASTTQSSGISDETAHAIDKEVRSIIDGCYERAKQILEDNMDKLHLMSDALMKYETIDRKQIDEIMQGHEPGPPESWDDDSDTPSSGGGNAPATGAGTSDSAQGGDDSGDKDKGVPSPAHHRQV